jgi:hypothetical protein
MEQNSEDSFGIARLPRPPQAKRRGGLALAHGKRSCFAEYQQHLLTKPFLKKFE